MSHSIFMYMKYRSQYMNKETSANKIRKLSKEQLSDIAKQCKYQIDVCKILDLPKQGHYKNLFMGLCDHYDIDVSHINESCKKVDLLGLKFGHLKVLGKGPTLKCGNTSWICREEETGIEKPVLTKHLKSGSTKSFSFGHKTGSEHKQWKGCGKISGVYWDTVKRHALQRKYEFSITIDQAWNLYLKQNRKCALSGVDIYFGESNACPYTASLDRIDSAKGYIIDNIQWVHSKVNIMKNKFNQNEFIDFCRKIASHSACPIK